MYDISFLLIFIEIPRNKVVKIDALIRGRASSGLVTRDSVY